MRYELVYDEMSRMGAEEECQADLHLLIEYGAQQPMPGTWRRDEEPEAVTQARERLHYRRMLAHYRAGVRFQQALELWRALAERQAMTSALGFRSPHRDLALSYDHPPIPCDGTWKPIQLTFLGEEP